MLVWSRVALSLAAAAIAAAGYGAARLATTPHVQAQSALVALRAPPSPYTYHGCPLYSPGDWFTTNLASGRSAYVPTRVDPKSEAIVRNLLAAYSHASFAGNVDPKAAAVNVILEGDPPAATAVINGLSYGFGNDPWNDDPPPQTIPVPKGRFFQEGTNGCAGDCHVVVLNASTCVSWETYGSGSPAWNGARYNALGGVVHNLRHPYDDQMLSPGVTAANTVLLGTTDWGEEASLAYIPHVLGFFLGLPNVANGGWVPPAHGDSGIKCRSFCTVNGIPAFLPYGARLRLHASFPCPDASSYPQADLICRQMKTYGVLFDDTTGGADSFGVRLGEAADGSNPWRAQDYNQLLDALKITDFDVMQLGMIH